MSPTVKTEIERKRLLIFDGRHKLPWNTRKLGAPMPVPEDGARQNDPIENAIGPTLGAGFVVSENH